MIRHFVALLILGFASMVYCNLCQCQPRWSYSPCKESRVICRQQTCHVIRRDPNGNEIGLQASCCYITASSPQICEDKCKCIDSIVVQVYQGYPYNVPQCVCAKDY
ncbi:uncharacterized protein LOC120338072 [Styela clava]|uniref:uncharacterized protein LOC120338072 n=1 Tax=Styela clava TaxID=7725 RepID=UPI001939AF84|nr:uncharacterized protein LOC120338072 [Styela clava]